MFKIIKEERVNRMLEIRDYFDFDEDLEDNEVLALKKYATSIEPSGSPDYSHIVKITYGNYMKWLMDECGYSEEEARKDADEWVKINDENSYVHHVKESISINPLMQKDFERMLKMNSVDDIYDYLIDITMSQSKNEAIDWLKAMLAYSSENKYNDITKAICKLLGEFGIHDFKDLFRIDIYD